MKILHIIPSLEKGGAERLVLDIVERLVSIKGVDAKLLIFRNKIEYNIATLQERIHCVNASVKLSVLGTNKIQVKELQDFIDAYQPDVIHSHLFEAELVSRSCSYPKAKWFSHGHGNMPQLALVPISALFSKKSLIQLYEKQFLLRRYSLNGGNNFIAISKQVESYLKSATRNKFNYFFLLNAINFKKFYKSPQRSFPLNQKLKLINVGSLNKRKNQVFLIELVAHLQEKGVDVELLMLGEGMDRSFLEERIKSLNLEEKCFLLGNIERVEDYLAEANCYVHASLYEPFGLVLLEAMAAGLPVVSIDGGGNRDILNNRNGIILKKPSVATFADSLLNLFNDKERYEEMSSLAVESAKTFDIEAYTNKLLDIYKS